MALFEWSSDYEIDIQQIDDQHKELVRLINILYESISDGRSGETVHQTLNALLQYVEIHFETEENAMRDRNYPGFEEHLLKHEELRSKVLDLRKEELQGREIATFELLNFLVDWLKTHIAQTDRAFGNYLHQTGLRNIG